MIDSHCHLADEAFADDVEAVVARARAAGVTRGLCVLSAEEPGQEPRMTAVATLWPALRFALGIHPHEAARFAGPAPERERRLRAALERAPRLSALGEIGLDYHYDLSPRDVQREVFADQVRLAGVLQLPMVIHTREAEPDTIAILDHEGQRPLRGVLHCFTGTSSLAAWALEAGLFVSFAGIITFANATALREVAATVPLDRLLVETDCPYLAPVPVRGSRNEPARVVEVARALASVKGVSLEDLERQVGENYSRLFDAPLPGGGSTR